MSPASIIDALPAPTCGLSTFDQDLDAQLGFLNFDGSNYATSHQRIASSLSGVGASDDEWLGLSSLQCRGRLQRRAFLVDTIV